MICKEDFPRMNKINTENLFGISRREFFSLPNIYQKALVNGSFELSSVNKMNIISDKTIDNSIKQKVMSIIRRNK